MRERHAKAIDQIVMTPRWELPQFLQKERKTRRPSQHANLPEIDVVGLSRAASLWEAPGIVP